MARFTTDDGVELEYEVLGEGDTTLLQLPQWANSLEFMRWTEPLTSEGIRSPPTSAAAPGALTTRPERRQLHRRASDG